MLSTRARTRQLNVTCASSVDMENFLHYSLIPSLFIILVLSFLQRREHRRQRAGTSYLLGNPFGIIMPLDFVGTFSNRWSYGIAFGATANKVMFLFSEGYQPLQVPQWAQAFVLLIGGFEVGLSHFPFFACLSSEFRLVSAILGFSYSLIWFAVTILHVAKCPHGQFLGRFQSVVFYWPSLLCLAFLLGRFLHMFAKSLRDHPGWELQAEPKPFLEVHQAEHVLRLLRRCPLSEKKKSWFQTRIYEWDPCFQFPSRMIGTTVLAFICLYLFMVIEFCVFIYVRDELAVFEGKLESYVTSTNKTGALTPVILQVKELISVSKEVWVVTILPAALTCVTYLFHILACYRCLKTCPVFKGCRIGDKSHQAPSRGISLKDTARTEGHRSSNLKNSSMSRGDGPTYLGSAYIMHMKRLWSGDRQFLPVKFRSPSPSESVPHRDCRRGSHGPAGAGRGHLLPAAEDEPGGQAEALGSPPQERVPQLQLLSVLLQRAAGPGCLPVPAAPQLHPGHVADRAHRQDHPAERLRAGRHGVPGVGWHALCGPLSHQPCTRQFLSHPDDRPQGEEAAEGCQMPVPKPITRAPCLSEVQDAVASATDPHEQPHTRHAQKVQGRARHPTVSPDAADELGELTLALTSATSPGQLSAQGEGPG
ncbi:stimulated by retinoic acid gene 6 protein-like isoform X2 [Tamandua tetradactyla]|uniref:stimulated by retinoic acid gene 6 protein-like isoform X2 n=1 Tax=Tamandua tetradactyla TaxID=48850 RepID=UPI0040548CE9